MVQKECQQVKTMLKELGTLAQRAEALKESIDSGEDIDVIKKTKEELQDIIHKHRVLRRNLKAWERRSKSIQRIDEVAEKLKKEGNDVDFSIDELHAIYKQDVRGFGDSSPFDFSRNIYSETKELRIKRQEEGKAKEDYARIYGCKPEQVVTEEDGVFKEDSNIVVFIGDINFTNEDLPETLKHVSGNLQSDSKNAKLPKNLEYVGGNLKLISLKEILAKGLKLPETVGGNLHLRWLTSAEGLVLPETLGGGLNLRSLESAKGLKLPETVGGDLYLSSLTSAEGLVLPETVGGDLDLESLTSAEGLVLPETVGGDLYLESLTSAEGLEKLNYASIIGNIYLPETFSDQDKEEVEEIKTKQREKGINVNFTYK